MAYNCIIRGNAYTFGVVDNWGVNPQKYIMFGKDEKRGYSSSSTLTLTDSDGAQLAIKYPSRDYDSYAIYSTVASDVKYVRGSAGGSSKDTYLVNDTEYVIGLYQTGTKTTNLILANVGKYGTDNEPSDVSKGTYVLEYTDVDYKAQKATFTEVNGNVRFYILENIPLLKGVKHTLTVSQDTGATVVNNVSNTTASYTYSSGVTGVTLKCNDGYMFDAAPTVVLHSSDSGISDVTFSLSLNDDGTTATGTGVTTSDESELTITITGSTKVIPTGATVVNNVSNTTASYTYSSGVTGVTLKCNDGYMFDAAPTVVLESDDPLIDVTTFTLTLNGDKTEATGNGKTDSDESELTITITGSTKVIPTGATVVNNVSNTTASYTYSSGVTSVTLKCNDGYMFDAAPTVVLHSSDSGISDVTFSLSLNDDGTTATGTGVTTSDESELTITITGSTKVIPTATTVTNNIEGGSTQLNYTVDGTTVTGTITGDNARRFFVGCKAAYDEISVPLEYSESDNKILPFTLTDVPTGAAVAIIGEYRGVCVTQNQLTGASLTGLKPYYIEGETITLTATANTGTSFSETNPPQLEWYDIGSQVTITKFTLSEDKKTATCSYGLPEQEALTSFTDAIVIGATEPDQTVSGYGSVNVYEVDDTALYQFAQARFKSSSSGETTYTYDNDLGDYINKLHKIYVEPTSTTDDTIKCGNYNTGIACKSLDVGSRTIDLGNVTIPTVNGNNTDLENNIQLFVPFVGMVGVDNHLCGYTINLSYTIDFVSGRGAYTLQTDGVPFQTGDCTVVENVIYRTATTQEINTIGSSSYNGYYLQGLIPYAVMTYYEQLTGNGVNNDSNLAKLGDLSGFCVVDDVTLSTTAEMTADEQETIISLLKRGVYIEA